MKIGIPPLSHPKGRKMFFFAVDSAQSAKADIQLIAVGSIAGVLVLMLLVFRSLLPLTLALSSIAAGVGFGEELEGNLHLASGGIRKAALELDVSFSSLRAMTLKHRGHLDGSIAIEGLVRAGTILGTIEVDLFSTIEEKSSR